MHARKLALHLAALGLGTALISTAAFAQDYKVGRAANDGGMVLAQGQQAPASGQRTGSASNTQATRPRGDTYAMGAQGAPPAAQSHYPVGRAANDGGMVSAQANASTGTQRTGSTANAPATRGPGYASNANGRTLYNSAAPQSTYHYPVGRTANDGSPQGK